ncbi:multidrug effflux MFS transporter [Kribbella sp. NPDC050470]|uniref:multidrug effflux MFS transporter n=1 Tax=unclassified Kribbella TaxID=2644121 RepID=UPI0037AFD7A4
MTLVIGALSAFGALTIDMYLPAMPVMADNLHTGAGLVQLTLTVFVVGLAGGQVLVGPLSDALGRRRLLLAGLAIYICGSIGCFFAPTIGWLIAARVVQSVGAAAATVLSRAMVRDLFDGAAMTRFFSSLMLVNGVAPIVAPIIGGQLLSLASWRVIFLVLASVGAALLAIVGLALPESLPPERRQPSDLRANLRTCAMLFRDTSYLRYVVAAALMFASMFAYISGSSFVLQDIYGLTAQQFSLVFAVNGLGIVLLGQVNSLLVHRVADENTLLGAGLATGAVGGLGVLVSTIAGLPLGALLVCLFVVVSMLGPVLANATSLALAGHGSAAGAASSFQGLLQFLIGGIVASTMGAFGDGSAVPMGAAMWLTATAALAVFATGLTVVNRRNCRRPDSVSW